MAHEIKNPLTPIKLSAQRLENSFSKNRENKNIFINCTNTIKRQVNNIQKLVTEFSNFARMPESEFRIVKLQPIIETQISTIKMLDEKIKIIYKNELKDVSINCDSNQLGRVFLNVLKNSFESSSKKNKIISIKIFKDGKYVSINIEDNGDGFLKIEINFLSLTSRINQMELD